MSSEDLPPIENPGGIGDPDESGGVFGTPWDRRTFLKSAALGSAAAAMYSGGSLFAPLSAYADDLSTLNCTANDVRIVGPGIILNEPCPDQCTGGVFNAQVQFHIINGTGTNRYCVTTHFCDGKDANGNVIVPAPANVVFGNIAANFDGNVTVTIPNYPCGSGFVCFGAAGTGIDGGFAKGENCPTGQCCSTITWNVKASDPCPDTTRQISSKCRHQQICIQGRGHTTVDCDTSTTGEQSDCTVQCGTTVNVRVCTTSPAALGPFKFELEGSTAYQGSAGETCHTFTTAAITATTTLTAKVTDKDGCVSTADVTLTTTAISPVIQVSGNTNCNGQLTFSAPDPSGFSGCTKAWTVDGTDASTITNTANLIVTVNANGTLTYRSLDGNCHVIGVTLTCGACNGSTTKAVTQCVTTTLGALTCPAT